MGSIVAFAPHRNQAWDADRPDLSAVDDLVADMRRQEEALSPIEDDDDLCPFCLGNVEDCPDDCDFNEEDEDE